MHAIVEAVGIMLFFAHMVLCENKCSALLYNIYVYSSSFNTCVLSMLVYMRPLKRRYKQGVLYLLVQNCCPYMA